MSDMIRTETAHSINGVPGRLNNLRRPPAPWKAGTFGNQTWVSESRPVKGYGTNGRMTVDIRFDDNCKNGHNTFAITADIRSRRGEEAGGCLHDEIAKVFPELAHLIKWHLCSTDGPMHYVANTVYMASDRDHHGLLKGEKRQIRNGRTGELCWQLVAIVDGAEVSLYDLQKNPQGDTPPVAPELRYVPWCRVGEGKARELESARRVAVWPEATDAELCADKATLTAALEARLPALLSALRADIEAAGFIWSCPSE